VINSNPLIERKLPPSGNHTHDKPYKLFGNMGHLLGLV
jgi:hypothetical protein